MTPVRPMLELLDVLLLSQLRQPHLPLQLLSLTTLRLMRGVTV